jgi:hypothetical protein
LEAETTEGVRLTATVAWKPPWTGNFSGCKLLDGLKRRPVTEPLPSRILS